MDEIEELVKRTLKKLAKSKEVKKYFSYGHNTLHISGDITDIDANLGTEFSVELKAPRKSPDT